jgi:hypothetical protein
VPNFASARYQPLHKTQAKMVWKMSLTYLLDACTGYKGLIFSDTLVVTAVDLRQFEDIRPTPEPEHGLCLLRGSKFQDQENPIA